MATFVSKEVSILINCMYNSLPSKSYNYIWLKKTCQSLKKKKYLSYLSYFLRMIFFSLDIYGRILFLIIFFNNHHN